MLTYPHIDPVIFSVGPLMIRWYSLAYIAGILLGGLYINRLNRIPPVLKNFKPLDDLAFFAILGIILGGRLGYVLFYASDYYLAHPTDILKLWEGGMSFHGGLIGCSLALFYFARKHHYPFLAVMDLVSTATPIGLFFGRLANFINGELYGRITNAPVGMIFPHGGDLPRHPSQLYEAMLEGVVTFFILFFLIRYTRIRHATGALTGSFLCCYALSRMIVEYFREPDVQLGFFFGIFTMGQLLCIPMLLLGLYLLRTAYHGQTKA